MGIQPVPLSWMQPYNFITAFICKFFDQRAYLKRYCYKQRNDESINKFYFTFRTTVRLLRDYWFWF